MCVIMAEEEIIEFTCNMQMQVDAKEGKAAVWSADRKKDKSRKRVGLGAI